MDRDELKERIARRAALELRSGDAVILGIGIPVRCARFLPKDAEVLILNDAGVIGEAELPAPERADPWHWVDSGGKPAFAIAGGAVADQAAYFGLVRGGHIDACILGCLECDAQGSLASWLIPDRRMPGMGGSMDICTGAKRVIVAMEHTNRGRPKIVERCSLPVTAVGCVDRIITELAVIDRTERGLVLREAAAGVTPEQICAQTAAKLIIDPNLRQMREK